MVLFQVFLLVLPIYVWTHIHAHQHTHHTPLHIYLIMGDSWVRILNRTYFASSYPLHTSLGKLSDPVWDFAKDGILFQYNVYR